MARTSIHPGLVVLVFVLAFLCTACANSASPTTVPLHAVDISTSTVTRTISYEPTSTSQPPIPTPTAVPPTQPLTFETFLQFQMLSVIENNDQAWDYFSSAISPDGRLAAVAGCLLEGDDKACHGTTFFRIFDLQTGASLIDPKYLSPAIEVLTFSPDGTVLAAAGCDINLWLYGQDATICDLPKAWLIDTVTGQIIAELTGYTSHVTDFAFNPDGGVLFISVVYDRNYGDGDHVIRVYDTSSGEKITTIETGMINCTRMLLDISPDGHYLVGNVRSPCLSQSFVAWWDVTDNRAPFQVGKVDGFGKSQVSPDSTQILVNNLKDYSLMVFDLKSGSAVKIIPPVPGLMEIRRFSYLDDSATIMLDLWDEYVIIDVSSGEIIHNITTPAEEYLVGYLLTPDRNTLLVLVEGEINHLDAWNLTTWQSIRIDLDIFYSWLFGQFFTPPNAVFLPDGSGFTGVSAGYGALQVQTWGVPDLAQVGAEQALQSYFDLLVSGDYDQAAAMYLDQTSVRAVIGPYIFFYPQYPIAYTSQMLPGMDFSDLPGVFASLCGNQDFPCLHLRDVLLRARLAEGVYKFMVTFALPDGSLADWSLCEGVPIEDYCKHRGGSFEYNVYQQPGGDYKIVEGLPPSIALLLRQ